MTSGCELGPTPGKSVTRHPKSPVAYSGIPFSTRFFKPEKNAITLPDEQPNGNGEILSPRLFRDCPKPVHCVRRIKVGKTRN